MDVAGRITLGEGSSALRDALRDMVGKNQKKILLNLAEVSYIDSSGIGELVSGFTTITNQGGHLKLLNLTKRVKDLLQITKLYTVFDVHEDEARGGAKLRVITARFGRRMRAYRSLTVAAQLGCKGAVWPHVFTILGLIDS